MPWTSTASLVRLSKARWLVRLACLLDIDVHQRPTDMNIESERLIALFDLDGVLVRNPDEALGNKPPITNKNFWDEHWKSPETAPIQQEMVDMAISLIGANWQIGILTARPHEYRPWTVTLLRRMGILVSTDPRPRISTSYSRPFLHMLPSAQVPQSSAAWKQETVKGWLDQGAKIQFMVEDYRPNAESVRAIVPVLLYERKKPSQYLALAHEECGGLARCLCPLKTASA